MLDSFLTLIVFAAMVILILSPVFATVAMKRTNRLERQLGLIEKRLQGLEENAAQSSGKLDDSTIVDPAEAEPVPEHDPRETAVTSPVSQVIKRPPIPEDAPVPAKSIEERLASQWLVWLGGVTIALAGMFLVKYSIDHELLSPVVRVSLGFLLGVCLVVGGEWLRQRPLQRAIASLKPDYVPPALTGAGLLICFSSVYASHAFLGLLEPVIVFVLLTAIAVGAMALSLLQGPYIAALGILGAFAVPLLVSTGSGSAWALFSYLLIVGASAFSVVHYKAWRWLAWAALIGAGLWDLLWLTEMWRAGDWVPMSIHLLGMFVLGLGASYRRFSKRGKALPSPFKATAMTSDERFICGAALLLAGLMYALVRTDGYDTGSLSVMGLVTVLLTVLALRFHRLEVLAAIAAALPALLLATWHLPEIVTLPEQIILGGRALGTLPAPVLPPEFSMFAFVAAAVSLWFGGAGYYAASRSASPVHWASISTVVPILALSIAFWRLAESGAELAWTAGAMVLASVATLAAVRLRDCPDSDRLGQAVGVYALAVNAAISLGATMALENAWLTVALATQLPAAAWVHNRTGIPALRWVAFVIAATVGARLLLTHQLPGIEWGVPKNWVWILYGYGFPAVAFALAARWFRKSADDRLVLTLESGAIAIAVAMVSLEIRHLVGEIDWVPGRYSLVEQSLHSISWLVSGYALYRRCRIEQRVSTEWGAKILIGLAAVQIAISQVLISNPLRTGESIGIWPLFDVLALAYLVPALLAIAVYFEAKRQEHDRVRIGAGIAAGLLLFCFLTLEVRHVFLGERLDIGGISNAEGYTYSVVWLLYAAALFTVGFLWQVAAIRHAALALTILIIAKVFLWDMSGLTGLYRVASFLGLGLSLVAIGFFYQRYMFGDRANPEDGGEEPG